MEAKDILYWITPISTSIITWFVSRRKLNNDFLSELQRSIDLLSNKYNETLKELVEVKGQNIKLLTTQAEMDAKITYLTKENAALKSTIDELNEKLNNVKTITRTK